MAKLPPQLWIGVPAVAIALAAMTVATIGHGPGLLLRHSMLCF